MADGVLMQVPILRNSFVRERRADMRFLPVRLGLVLHQHQHVSKHPDAWFRLVTCTVTQSEAERPVWRFRGSVFVPRLTGRWLSLFRLCVTQRRVLRYRVAPPWNQHGDLGPEAQGISRMD
jgi:hypothetical protein